ncbi:hypothetical protein MA16_Dca013259 [Dendrobium catenatum]|uniref:Uncharacterized protein n=1 Tax=Dendrobium catenatum TaxID=906689 RepID=A0A2I0WDD8_9ASPA|nr:hypothetical protein MA16_Dca013259 [Dendrobium catenatum]
MTDDDARSEGSELAEAACVEHEMVEEHELEPKQEVDIHDLANAYSSVRDGAPVRDLSSCELFAQFHE